MISDFKKLQNKYNQNPKPDLMQENGVKIFMVWYEQYAVHIDEFFNLLYGHFGLDRNNTEIFDKLVDIKNIYINTCETQFIRRTAICVNQMKKQKQL